MIGRYHEPNGWISPPCHEFLAGDYSQSVTERLHEFGIRKALGAESADGLRLTVHEGLRIVAWGAPLGLSVLWR